MPDNNIKSIKFKFELDNQSFKIVQDAVKSLTQELQKLGGAMGTGGAFPGLSIGGQTPNKSTQVAQGQAKAQQAGGGVQGPTMGKVILENAQAFKKFAVESKDASKIMTDALKRDIKNQEDSLNSLKNKLKEIGKEYSELGNKQKAMQSRGWADESLKGQIADVEGRMAGTAGQLLKGQKQLAGMKQAAGMPTGGGGFGGFMSSIGYTGSGFGPGPLGLLKGIAGALAGAVAVGQFGLSEVREGGGGIFAGSGPSGGQGGMDIRAEARRGQLLNQRIRALRRGDITQLMIQDEIRRDSNKSAYYDQQMDAIAKAEAYAKGGMEGLGRLPIIKQALGVLGKDSGAGTALEGLTTAEIQAKLLENVQNVEAQVSQSSRFLDRQMAFEHFQGTFANRVSARRMMGLTLEGTHVPGQGMRGRYGDFAARMAEQQLGEGAYLGNLASLRMAGGAKFGGTLAGYETLSQAGGYSGFGQMAAQANRGAPNAQAAFQLARGALGGGISVGAGMQLGQMAFGYNPLGTTSGEGFLAATQGGIDWSSMTEGQQFNKVQALGGAMNVGNRIMSGGLDPAMLGLSTVRAKQILGPGASTRAIDYLASGMDMRQMMDIGFRGGESTDAMKVHGISKQDVRKEFSAKVAGMLRGELTDPDTAQTVDKVIKGLESGMSMEAIVHGVKGKGGLSKQEKMQLGVAVQHRTMVGGEEASALVDLMGGLGLGTRGRKIKRGDALGAKLVGPEAAEAQRQAEEFKRQEGVLREENTKGGLEEKIKGTQEAAKAQSQFGQNLGGSVTILVEHLDKLSTAIVNAANKINSGKPGMQNVKAK